MTGTIALECAACRPGEIIAGEVTWQAAKPPRTVELRLFWRTEGSGDQDVGIAETLPFVHAQSADTRDFSLTAPESPLSYSGKLFAVRWALELVLDNEAIALCDLVIGPNAREITIS